MSIYQPPTHASGVGVCMYILEAEGRGKRSTEKRNQGNKAILIPEAVLI